MSLSNRYPQDYTKFIFPIIHSDNRYYRNRNITDYYSNARKVFFVDYLYTIDQIEKSETKEMQLSIIKNREDNQSSPKLYFNSIDTLAEDSLSKEIQKYNEIVNSDGMYCKKCNTFNKYATAPNQSDGSYVCYGCRSGF